MRSKKRRANIPDVNDRVLCTCNGLNESCYRCFGRGYYYKGGGEPIYGLVKCPECGILISEKRLQRHIRKVHKSNEQSNFISTRQRDMSININESPSDTDAQDIIVTSAKNQLIPIGLNHSMFVGENTQKIFASNADLEKNIKKLDIRTARDGHNVKFNYKSVFGEIESSLLNNLSVSQNEFYNKISPFKKTKYWDFRNRTNKNIFWVLSYVNFFGQNDPAYIIEGQLEIINETLCEEFNDKWIEWEVDYDRLSSLSIQEKNKLITTKLKFGRWGSIKGTDFSGNEIAGVNRYLKWIIENASSFSKLIKNNNNSFGEYVRRIIRVQDLKNLDLSEYDSINPGVMNLRKELKKRFFGFGERTTYHFLGDLGFNVNKPDKVVCRILNRLGLIDSESDIENALIQVQNFANETGNIARYIDIILVKFGQKGISPMFGTKSGICSDVPSCHMCMARQYCKYYRR